MDTRDVSQKFPPIKDDSLYGIYDTEMNVFVQCRYSGKLAWDKPAHAKNAFSNSCGILMKNQTRYITKQILWR